MSKKPVYSQLPDVGDDVESLRTWAKIATQILRTMTGETGSGTGGFNKTFVTSQGNPTQVQPVGVRDGDLWVALPTRQGQTLQRALWVNGSWIVLNGQW